MVLEQTIERAGSAAGVCKAPRIHESTFPSRAATCCGGDGFGTTLLAAAFTALPHAAFGAAGAMLAPLVVRRGRRPKSSAEAR